MRRSLAFLVVVLALVDCQQATVAPSAQLVGLRDMVKVGTVIVATSTERDELRVLNLETGDTSQVRKFLRAPNPIQALSIPVLRRPTELTADSYFEGGTETTGPYVYAWSQGTPQLSIVWAENVDAGSAYTEVGRLATIAPVVAVAAQGSAPVEGRPQPGTTYFATFDGRTSTLFALPLKPPTSLGAGTIFGQDLQASVIPLSSTVDETVVDMIALPGGQLAIAMQSTGGGALTGRAFVYDTATRSEVRALQFPGPVRALYTHPQFELPGIGTIPAGGRVYGVLDEDACGSVTCGGLVSVDTATGLRTLSEAGAALGPGYSRDVRVAPPLTFGEGLIQSVSLAPNGTLTFPGTITPDGLQATRTLPLLGVATLSNGQIGFFLAGELRQLNTSPFPSVQVFLPDAGGYSALVTPAGLLGVDAGVIEGPVDQVRVANGAARDETIRITPDGLLPDLVSVVADPTGFLPSVNAGRAVAGDLVEGCADGGTVAAVEDGGLRLAGACGSSLVTVRATAAPNYVVEGTASGYMGRAAAGQRFTFAGQYLHHFPGYDPNVPAFSFDLPAAPLAADAGERIEIIVDDGYLPMVLKTTLTACAAGFTQFPGTVVTDVQPDSTRSRAFVAYPSANGIVEIELNQVRRSFNFDTRVLCWR